MCTQNLINSCKSTALIKAEISKPLYPDPPEPELLPAKESLELCEALLDDCDGTQLFQKLLVN